MTFMTGRFFSVKVPTLLQVFSVPVVERWISLLFRQAVGRRISQLIIGIWPIFPVDRRVDIGV